MSNFKNKFLPEVYNDNEYKNEQIENTEVIGDSICPCCGYLTIPNKGDACGYICPVCMWEIDPFISEEYECSDLNHGLSLKEARDNYNKYKAVLKRLKPYCREPREYEK